MLISRLQHQSSRSKAGRGGGEADRWVAAHRRGPEEVADEMAMALRERQELIESRAQALAEAALEGATVAQAPR